MPKRIISELKTFFKAGKRPTEKQFEDMLDSYVHLDNPDFAGSDEVGSVRTGILKHLMTKNSSTHLYHIKLPYKVDTHTAMYYLHASGYSYQSGEIIDIIWTGYCYRPSNAISKTKTHINRSTAITAGQYVGTDSSVYLWFKVPNIYYTTFRLDAMKVGNGTMLKQGDIQLTVSDLAQL